MLKQAFLTFVLVSGGFTLSSCTPSAMPAGYKYHHNIYKTPPAPKAAPIGYEYSNEMNESVMAHVHKTAADLVDKMEKKYLIPDKELYLAPPAAAGVLYRSFDLALREALSDKGYALLAQNETPVTMMFTLEEPEEGDIKKRAADIDAAETYKPVAITLYLKYGDNPEYKLRAIYTMPVYGFAPAGALPLRDTRPVAEHNSKKPLRITPMSGSEKSRKNEKQAGSLNE